MAISEYDTTIMCAALKCVNYLTVLKFNSARTSICIGTIIINEIVATCCF